MLNLFAPLSAPRTDRAFREDVLSLCQNLKNPGFSIPPGADEKLAEALFSREMGSAGLIVAALNLLRANPRVAAILDAAEQGNTAYLDQLLADGTMIAFLAHPLVQAMLYSSLVPDIAFERLLMHVRKRLLECAFDMRWTPDANTMKVVVALAAYCYLTEYIFDVPQDEVELIDALDRRLAEQTADDMDVYDGVVLGCYRPLGALTVHEEIERALSDHPNSLIKALWRIQVTEPERELSLRQEISSLTPIEDDTSVDVRALYEENPYPRWACFHYIDPQEPEHALKVACPNVDITAFGDSTSINMLVAGCGTGIAAIEETALWKNATVLAIDLSLTSLAFAKRCAEDLGVNAIEFAQADILSLPSLNRSFDYIACTGVLHHMSDPVAGLKALSSILRPGGVMRAGLYSEPGRRDVIAAAQMVQDGLTYNGPDTVRAARRRLMDYAAQSTRGKEWVGRVFATFDFYNLSMCRDLLFHVQEVNFTLPKVESALQAAGLRFCGIVDPERRLMQRYAAFAPSDPLGLDLRSWQAFEDQHPETFSPMYDFMVQKIV